MTSLYPLKTLKNFKIDFGDFQCLLYAQHVKYLSIFRSYDYLPYNKLNPTEDALSSLSNHELLALLSHEEKLVAEENKNEKKFQRRKQIRFQDRRDEVTSRSDSRNYEDRIYRHHNSIIGKKHVSKNCSVHYSSSMT